MCANDSDSSDVTDSESSCEEKLNNFTLMAFEKEYADSDLNDEEVEVDMEGELISALEEIDRLRLKKRKQKQLLIQYEQIVKEPSADFTMLKVELEEANKIPNILRQQLTESKTRCEALEIEVVISRKEFQKFQALYLQNISSIKASEELNNILNKQRSPLIKTGLGYEKGASSSQSENIEQTNMINFQSSKQSEFTKPAISIKAGANRNDKLMTSKKNVATGTYDNTLHLRNNEEDLNIRIENSDQLYQSSSSNG